MVFVRENTIKMDDLLGLPPMTMMIYGKLHLGENWPWVNHKFSLGLPFEVEMAIQLGLSSLSGGHKSHATAGRSGWS